MNYKNFDFTANGWKITHKRAVFFKTSSGKSWKSKPEYERAEIVTNDVYNNFVKSVDFFNGFCGGTCRASWNYTPAGYLPVNIATVSPDRTEKIIDTFLFDWVGVE